MPATLPNIQFYAGDDFSRTLTFLRNDAPRDLVAEGWANWKVQWRKSRQSATFIEATVVDSQANSGIITITFSAAQTRAMAGPGVWDMQAVHNGQAYTWWTGSTTWLEDVTRVA